MSERIPITKNHKLSFEALIRIAVARDDLPAAKKAKDRLLEEFSMVTSSFNKEENLVEFALVESILSDFEEFVSVEMRNNMKRLLDFL